MLDSQELSITYHLKERGNEAWVRFGASTTTRGDETDEAASDRLQGYVESRIAIACARVLENLR